MRVMSYLAEKHGAAKELRTARHLQRWSTLFSILPWSSSAQTTGIRSTSEFAVVYAKLGTKKIAQSTSTSKLHLTSASRTSLQASHGAKVPLLPQVPALKLRRVPRTVRRLH